jgi:hypothetical protein
MGEEELTVIAISLVGAVVTGRYSLMDTTSSTSLHSNPSSLYST